MALTDIAVKNAKPGPKTTRLRDERGLYLEISPKGGKWWRLRYTFGGKANMLSLGVYPDISLKEARDRRDEARKLIANGIDPSAARKAGKVQTASEGETFEIVAREWHFKTLPKWTASTAETIITRLVSLTALMEPPMSAPNGATWIGVSGLRTRFKSIRFPLHRQLSF